MGPFLRRSSLIRNSVFSTTFSKVSSAIEEIASLILVFSSGIEKGRLLNKPSLI